MSRSTIFVISVAAVLSAAPAVWPSQPAPALSRGGIAVSGFLPVVTAEANARLALAPGWDWGGAIAGFYALGRSIHAELFVEPIYLFTRQWRLASRLGVLAGWGEEFSFGPPPEQFAGVGVHLQPLEAQLRLGHWYVGLASGIRVLTDFQRFAGSLYVGASAGVVLGQPGGAP